MTATATTRTSTRHSARPLALAVVLAVTGLGLQAAPVEVPRPAELAPEPALAYACADGPSFEGWLTNSTGSHPNITISRTGAVYAWINKVVDDWGCTAYYRYDGIMWALSATTGNFAWGTLIHSTSVSCNWALNSSDYIKANSTSDCPDSDAEYAYHIALEDASAGSLFEGTLDEDATPDARGDTAFVHSDCESYYGASSVRYNRAFGTGTGPRPGGGTNCDPYDLDGFNYDVDLTVDGTEPEPPTTPDLAAASDTGASSTDNITNDTTPTFSGSAEANATITLYDGAAQIGTDVLAVGETAWSITPTAAFTSGTHSIIATATDVAGNPSEASAALPVTIDTAAPAAPSIPDLAPGSDTGTSSTDNITSDTTPEFTGTAEANATVTVYDGTTPKGSQALTGGATAWSITTPALTLATHTITAKASDPAGNTSGASGALPVTISTTGPAATYSASPATPTNVATLGYTLTFGEPVTGLAVSDLAVSGTATGWTATVGSPAGNAWPVTLSGGGEGTVILTLAANSVTGTATTGPSAPTAAPAVTVDRTAPTATIETPEANRALGGPVTVTGTATDQSFKDYRLEYGTGTLPATWTTIGTYTTPVAGDTLGTWSPGFLSGIHTIRLTVTDLAGNNAQATRTVVLENGMRGDEAFYTRVPYDLGGGWALDVGVANGEARLARDLFSIPSYGPAQALSLTYSSLETGSAGRFGVGWSSNLTQYLTFESGFVVWHRADGGRVPFGLVAGTWTPPRGHHETMSRGGTEDTITLKDQTRVIFENGGSGRLKRIENRFGKALTLSWTTSSATATDASMRATNVEIDSASGRVTRVTDSAGRAWDFGYANGDLTSVTDPAAKVTTLGYDAEHRLTTVTRSRSRVSGGPETITWTVGYVSGKVASVVDAIAHAAHGDVANTFSYTTDNTDVGLLQGYSPLVRNTWSYTLDHLGRATTILNPEGHATTRDFDAASNETYIAQEINGGSATWTQHTYDTRGNRTLTVVRSSPMGEGRTTALTYNATNDLLTRSEADDDSSANTVTRYGYDAAGHLLTVNVNCTSTGTTPPVDASTCTGNGAADASTNLVTTYTYTASDQVETETDPLGRVTKHVFDSATGYETHKVRNYIAGQSETAERNVTTDRVHDEGSTPDIGLVTTETDPLDHATTRTYDALGRVTSEVLPGDASIPVLTRTTTYDELGNVLTETESWTPLGEGSPVSRTTSHVYDLANRETSSSDASGVTSSHTYDAAGNTLSESDGGSTTTRAFDAIGQPVAVTANGVTTTYTYDGLGNPVTSVVDGATRTMEYDMAGQLLYEYLDDGDGGLILERAHGYDSLGRETYTEDANGVRRLVAFDRAGRQIATIENDVPGTPGPTEDVTTTFIYDRAGNQTGVTGPDGRLTTTVYDALDRAVRVIVNDVAAPSGPDQDVTSVTVYDGAGNAIATIDPKGVVTRTFVNPRNLAARSLENCRNTPPVSDPVLCTGSASASASINVERTTTYDGRGEIAAAVLHRLASDPDIVTEETRDAAGRLVQSVVDAGAGRLNLTTDYAFDAAGRQIAVRDPRGTITRTIYDAAGRVSATIVNCTLSDDTIPTTDWGSCPGTGTRDGTRNVTTTYGYDASGNRTTETAPNGRVTTSVFDDANRLVQRIDNDVTTPTQPDQDLSTYFYYDAAGRQVAVKAPTLDRTTFAVTRSIYDDLGRLTEEIRNCVGGGDGTPAQCTGSGVKDAQTNVSTTYAYDTGGRVVVMTVPDPSATSGTATVTTRYAYDAVGRLCRVLENASIDPAGLADPCTSAVAGTTTSNVSTRYAYDPAGLLVSMTDAAGNATTYAYDAAGRMTERTDALGATVAWTYDLMGNRVTQRNRTDAIPSYSVIWTYDAAGRLRTRLADGVTTTYTPDENGNQLTASDGTLAIAATYDRLDRVLTVDDEDGGTAADTTYTYDLASPRWTDPTGTYLVTLDKFDRATALDEPVSAAASFSWAYRADGQPSSRGEPNGNTTTYGYDALGRASAKETKTGSTSRAAYAWTRNRAGQVLSEQTAITSDPTSNTRAFAYDALARLAAFTDGATTTSYGWAETLNRTSVQVGAGPAIATTYDIANRPVGQAGIAGAYTSDADGRLTARPTASGGAYQQLEWDRLGRLTKVKGPEGSSTIATYTYDPLDRLRMVDYGGGNRVRFRYQGLTTSAVQTVNDQTGAVIRSIGTSWTGKLLEDWTGTNANWRVYGTNGHHDVTWTAGSGGTVTGTVRYDPWGTATSVTGSVPEFRFQASWADDTAKLGWVVTRWYAPAQGRFISEDSLLGEPRDPDSRHLYAYGGGDPVGAWDPEGTTWYRTRAGDTLKSIALRYWGVESRWPTVWNANRNRVPDKANVRAGLCIYIRRNRDANLRPAPNQCGPAGKITGGFNSEWTRIAAQTLGVDWYNLTAAKLNRLTESETGRVREPNAVDAGVYSVRSAPFDAAALAIRAAFRGRKATTYANMTVWVGNSWLPTGVGSFAAITVGHTVFWDGNYSGTAAVALMSHEYVHVLQIENGGLANIASYGWNAIGQAIGRQEASGPGNRNEAIGYLWEGWVNAFREYGAKPAWCTFQPTSGGVDEC